MTTKKNPKCCLCGRECENEWGNNPWPLAEKGVCCDECNDKVVAARIAQATGEDIESLTATLREARKKGMEFIAQQRMKQTQ